MGVVRSLGRTPSIIDRKLVEVKHPIYMNATYLVPDCWFQRKRHHHKRSHREYMMAMVAPKSPLCPGSTGQFFDWPLTLGLTDWKVQFVIRHRLPSLSYLLMQCSQVWLSISANNSDHHIVLGGRSQLHHLQKDIYFFRNWYSIPPFVWIHIYHFLHHHH